MTLQEKIIRRGDLQRHDRIEKSFLKNRFTSVNQKKTVPSHEDTAQKESFFPTDVFLKWSDPPRTDTLSASIGRTKLE